jgi:hypothetical protein
MSDSALPVNIPEFHGTQNTVSPRNRLNATLPAQPTNDGKMLTSFLLFPPFLSLISLNFNFHIFSL